MSDKPPPARVSAHPAVQQLREKLESISENQLEDLKKINERLGRFTTPAPSKVPEIQETEPDPFPSDPPHDDEETP